MDQRRFDDLTRLLGASGTRRGGLRAALGGLLGVGMGAFALDAEARRQRHDDAGADRRHRRKRCRPACTNGYECVKVGRKRACQCLSGVTCSTACCQAGQVCQDGACVAPQPACIPFGETCKDTGRACCDNLVCASGQGGEDDVACWVRKTGRCATTAECVYGTVCTDGACVGLPQPEPEPLCTVCASGCPHATIAGALADAGLSTITVSTGVYKEPNLQIARSLTLEDCGDGPVTIDAMEQSRVLLVALPYEPEGTVGAQDIDLIVTIRGLALINGKPPAPDDNGAGILDQSSSLTLERVTIANCSTTTTGGGIQSTGQLTLKACTIENCSAGQFGGGVYVLGVLTTLTDTAIRHCRVTEGANSGGGGIMVADGSALALDGATSITGNQTAEASVGGGVGSGTATVTCSGGQVTICQNTSNSAANNCIGTVATASGCGCCANASG